VQYAVNDPKDDEGEEDARNDMEMEEEHDLYAALNRLLSRPSSAQLRSHRRITCLQQATATDIIIIAKIFRYSRLDEGIEHKGDLSSSNLSHPAVCHQLSLKCLDNIFTKVAVNSRVNLLPNVNDNDQVKKMIDFRRPFENRTEC